MILIETYLSFGSYLKRPPRQILPQIDEIVKMTVSFACKAVSWESDHR